MDCTTKNVIYCIKCIGCKNNYIGQTGDQLKNRMTVHRQQINNAEGRQTSLSEHLDNCSKDYNNFMVIPFYKVKRDDEDTEKLWRPISFQTLSLSLTNDGHSALSFYYDVIAMTLTT